MINSPPNNGWKSLPAEQRRTQSIDEYSLQILNENYYGNTYDHRCPTIDEQIKQHDGHSSDTSLFRPTARTNCRSAGRNSGFVYLSFSRSTVISIDLFISHSDDK